MSTPTTGTFTGSYAVQFNMDQFHKDVVTLMNISELRFPDWDSQWEHSYYPGAATDNLPSQVKRDKSSNYYYRSSLTQNSIRPKTTAEQRKAKRKAVKQARRINRK